jgi:hypothetical protein
VEEDITLPLMLALERLSPLEPAAFLLHDVFGIGFEEIAVTIQRSPAACRQLAAGARAHAREARPRFQVDKQRGLESPTPSLPLRVTAIWRIEADAPLSLDIREVGPQGLIPVDCQRANSGFGALRPDAAAPHATVRMSARATVPRQQPPCRRR